MNSIFSKIKSDVGLQPTVQGSTNSPRRVDSRAAPWVEARTQLNSDIKMVAGNNFKANGSMFGRRNQLQEKKIDSRQSNVDGAERQADILTKFALPDCISGDECP